MKVLLQSFFILQTLQVQFHGITGGIVPTPPPYMASSRKHASLSQSEQSIKKITMFNACKTLDVRNTPCLVSFSKKSTHLNWPSCNQYLGFKVYLVSGFDFPNESLNALCHQPN